MSFAEGEDWDWDYFTRTQEDDARSQSGSPKAQRRRSLDLLSDSVFQPGGSGIRGEEFGPAAESEEAMSIRLAEARVSFQKGRDRRQEIEGRRLQQQKERDQKERDRITVLENRVRVEREEEAELIAERDDLARRESIQRGELAKLKEEKLKRERLAKRADVEAEKKKFEASKSREIERLNEEFHSANNNLTLLVQAQERQEDENREYAAASHRRRTRIAEEMTEMNTQFEEFSARMTENKRELDKERDNRVNAGEQLRIDILESNTELLKDQEMLVRNVAELTGRQKYMQAHAEQPGWVADPNVSNIQNGPAAGGENQQTGQASNSTPAVGYNPFVNGNADRNVGAGSVYRGPGDRDDDPNYPQADNGNDGSYVQQAQSGGQYQGHAQSTDVPQPNQQGNSGGHYQGNGNQQVGNYQGNHHQGGNQGNGNQSQGNHQGTAHSNNQATRVAQPKSRRRTTMSLGMATVFDNNPGLHGLGVDSVGSTNDDTEVIEWSRRQAAMLQGPSAQNAARRPAGIIRDFKGIGPWKTWFSGFVEEMKCFGWSAEDAKPYLVKALSAGCGSIAVEVWKENYGENGTFEQLVQTASYLLGNIAAENPMNAFNKRAQHKGENHRVYGLELQSLLRKARPRMSRDDPEFLQELYRAYHDGLGDQEHRDVVFQAWNPNASLTDLFIAIDHHDTKRRLMPGRVVRTSSVVAARAYEPVQEVDEQAVEGTEQEVEENICGLGWQNKSKFTNGKQGNTSAPYSNKPYPKQASSDRPAVPQHAERPTVPVTLTGPAQMAFPTRDTPGYQDYIDDIAKSLQAGMDAKRRAEYVPEADKICWRCQQKGHSARFCTAEKPVARGN